MIDLKQITSRTLETDPFSWAAIDHLYSPDDAAALASSFPHDHFKTVIGNDGEKKYEYEARSLVPMGEDSVSFPEGLSNVWLELAHDLCSLSYRMAISELTGYDLRTVPLEVNLFHYDAGASLGPHLDLHTKLVTHAIYFNPWWDVQMGGCLNILRSGDPAHVATEVLPIVGNSAVIVRSDKSWHAVSRVIDGCTWSRRSLTATFYRPASPSTLWPMGDTTPLHHYDVADM